MKNNIFSFENITFNNNDFVLLDTCFVLNQIGHDISYISNNSNEEIKKNNDSKKLIEKITNADAIFALSSTTVEELHDVVIRELFKTRHNITNEVERKLHKLNHPEQYKRIIAEANVEVEDYLRRLKLNDNFYPEFVQFEYDNKLISEVQDKYLLHGRNDASQIALCLQQQFTHFVTTDSDFLTVTDDNLKIVVDNNTYAKKESKK